MFEIEKPEPRILISGSIDNTLSTEIINFISGINQRYPQEEITVEIDSGGGILSDVTVLAELFRRVSNPIRTVALSSCSSGAVLLAAAGDKGRRLAWDSCEFMIHQLQVEECMSGSFVDFERTYKELKRVNDHFLSLMSEFTGQPFQKIKRDTLTNRYMSADQALRYGIIDTVIPILKQR